MIKIIIMVYLRNGCLYIYWREYDLGITLTSGMSQINPPNIKDCTDNITETIFQCIHESKIFNILIDNVIATSTKLPWKPFSFSSEKCIKYSI